MTLSCLGKNCSGGDVTGFSPLVFHAAFAMAICAGLAACSSGGGSGRSAIPSSQQVPVTGGPQHPTSPNPTDPSGTADPDTKPTNQKLTLIDQLSIEHLDQEALQDIGAPAARGRIDDGELPGSRVRVGVLDFGVYTDHPAFEDISIREVYSHSTVDQTGVDFSHGTAVASLVAMTAPGVDIVSIAVDTADLNAATSTRARYDHYSPQRLRPFDSRWQKHLETAFSNDVDILNISIGFDGIISDYNTAALKQDLRREFGDAIDAMAQADTAEADRTVLVWAAGNANGVECNPSRQTPSCIRRRVAASDVEVLPGLASLYADELQDHFIVVVAVDTVVPYGASPGEAEGIAPFSNRCGMAAAYCIAAPGVDTSFAYYGQYFNDGSRNWVYAYDEGTSYSAPIVTGGLALIMDKFNYSATEARSRLFATANSQGNFSARSIYGHGLMDLDAATRAVGAASIVLGPSARGPGAPLSSTRLSFGPAFGASALRFLSGRRIAAFDEMAAPFWHDLGSLFSIHQTSLSAQLKSMHFDSRPASDGKRKYMQSAAFPSKPQMGFSNERAGYRGLGGTSLTLSWSAPASPIALQAFTTEGVDQQQPVTGAAIEWKPLGLGAGLLAERASALGVAAEGGFGRLSAESLYASLRRSLAAGYWRFDADSEAGVSLPSARGGMLTGIEPVFASRFSLSASRAADSRGNSMVRFALEQPLRAERALASLRAPVGRTKTGAVVFERWRTDFAPNGRQLDLSAWWSGETYDGGQLGLGAIYSRHPGHDGDASPTLSLLVGHRLTF